ncbi:hypothetical protein [Cellulosimicrobium cellulans]|uniref:hypothetical protein n=1 Tax=Cellulosimicrobium cellulans TaxID=1710 RepID=UPI00130DF4CA|nr:hypothetical protein [Cellulosimicrobium cellulans]
MRTTRTLGITLATGALVLGGTAGAALADEGGGFTVCLDGVTQTFGPGYSLGSFLADGAAEGACPETWTDRAPALPVPVASTVGQVLDPRTPDPGSGTEVPGTAVPTAVPEEVLPTAVPELSSTTLDVPPTTGRPSTEPEPSLATPEPGSSTTIPAEAVAAGRSSAAAETPQPTVATSPTAATVASSPASSSATPTASAPQRHVTASAGPHLAVTGAPVSDLLLLAAAAIAAGLGLRGATRVRRAGR